VEEKEEETPEVRKLFCCELIFLTDLITKFMLFEHLFS